MANGEIKGVIVRLGDHHWVASDTQKVIGQYPYFFEAAMTVDQLPITNY